MAMRIRNKRDVWLYTAIVTVFAIACSETGIGILYLTAGPTAFHLGNVIMMAALLPVVIAVPITFYVARTSMKLASSQAELKQLANTDPLTGLPNRRSFFRAAEYVLAGDETTSLLVIDADHFKELNDSYGHAIGDKALVAIADVLRTNFRRTDLICRVGGEEFAVLLPDTDIALAERLANRVVTKVAASPLSEPNAVIEYSVSCGVADTNTNRDLQELFKAADDAMYVAKKQGRNRVARLRTAA